MSMAPEEAIRMLEAKSKCMKREVSGTDFDCNFRNCYKCDLNYEQGTIGDQIEVLSVAISALQAQDLQQTCNQLATDCIRRSDAIDAFGLSEKTRKYGGDHSGYDTMMLYEIQDVLEGLPPAQKKGYTKADYIMALHKEYGCSLARAEEAHQKALEYLRNTSMMKG